MTKYDEWQKVRAERFEAERWAGLLGKASVNATHRHVGVLRSASGSFCIHYQPSDGATNYHDSSKAFNAALEQVMKDEAPALIAKTLNVMRELERHLLISCEDEVQKMQNAIAAAKRASEAA